MIEVFVPLVMVPEPPKFFSPVLKTNHSFYCFFFSFAAWKHKYPHRMFVSAFLHWSQYLINNKFVPLFLVIIHPLHFIIHTFPGFKWVY